MDLKLIGGLTLEEALHMAYDEDLDVGQIYMEPPDAGTVTDEDSGEDDGAGLIDNLSSNQWNTNVQLYVKGLHNNNNSNVEEGVEEVEKVNYSNIEWVKRDLEEGKDARVKEEYPVVFGKCTAPLLMLSNELPEEKKKLGYNLFADNLFSSFHLPSHLKTRGYSSTGTIRDTRIPNNCPRRQILLARWKDNNVVSAASTRYGVAPVRTVKRYSVKEKRNLQVPRPYMISKDNASMGGTDLTDENIARWRISLRGKKWWWCLFMWLIDASIQNAWVLYKKSGNILTQLEFRREIVKVYLNNLSNEENNENEEDPNDKHYVPERMVAEPTEVYDESYVPERNVRRSSQTPKSRKSDDNVYVASASESDNDPITITEALSCNERKDWEATVQNELQSLRDNNTWRLVELPKQREAIKK
ncbi:Transposase IS4 [Popillia japonica]|uniref:Transposase IS4 n=1 Tax=Popillia japonica TaxID=7064 RepID=A0AAW1NDQ3_POPJA